MPQTTHFKEINPERKLSVSASLRTEGIASRCCQSSVDVIVADLCKKVLLDKVT